MFLGGTLTALLAASICGLLVSTLLHIANNPHDYLFLLDIRDYLKEKTDEAKQMLQEYSSNYNAKRKLTLGEINE